MSPFRNLDKQTRRQLAYARKWLYGVTAAALPVLVHYGVLGVDALPVLIPLLVAFFNVSFDSGVTTTTQSIKVVGGSLDKV